MCRASIRCTKGSARQPGLPQHHPRRGAADRRTARRGTCRRPHAGPSRQRRRLPARSHSRSRACSSTAARWCRSSSTPAKRKFSMIRAGTSTMARWRCWWIASAPPRPRSSPARSRTTGAAYVLGQRTFGKGTVQNLVPLSIAGRPEARQWPADRHHRQVLSRHRREHPASRRRAGRRARLAHQPRPRSARARSTTPCPGIASRPRASSTRRPRARCPRRWRSRRPKPNAASPIRTSSGWWPASRRTTRCARRSRCR
jgi:hypothetical protein